MELSDDCLRRPLIVQRLTGQILPLSLSEPRPAFLPCVPQLILDCLAFRYLAFPFVILPYLTLGYLALRTFEWAPHQFKFIFEWAPRQLRFILEWAPRQCRFIFEWAPYYFSASWYILYGPLAPNQSVCNGIRTQSTTTAIAWQAPYRSSYNRPINSLDHAVGGHMSRFYGYVYMYAVYSMHFGNFGVICNVIISWIDFCRYLIILCFVGAVSDYRTRRNSVYIEGRPMIGRFLLFLVLERFLATAGSHQSLPLALKAVESQGGPRGRRAKAGPWEKISF